MTSRIQRRRGSNKEVCAGIVSHMTGPRQGWRTKPADVTFRWGSLSPVQTTHEINSLASMKLVNDKPWARMALGMQNIRIPDTYFIKEADMKFPVIGRPRKHSQGKCVTISQNREELASDVQSAYWSQIIEKDSEYRVFVLWGRILGACQKNPTDPAAVVWNNDTGGSVFQTLKPSAIPSNIIIPCLKSAQTLGVDFTAVDVMTKGDQVYIIELNNAPQLSEYRQKLFGRGFQWLLNRIERDGELPPKPEIPTHITGVRDYLHSSLLKAR